MTGAGLAGFNALDDGRRRTVLLGVCSAPRWAAEVAAGAPYADPDAVLTRADAVLAELADRDLDDALAGHPRIGERADNPLSQREQAGVAGASSDVAAELARRNLEYEDRFGFVYLVCARGRSAVELLAVLNRRLHNDHATERTVLRAELAAINRLRLRDLLDAPVIG